MALMVLSAWLRQTNSRLQLLCFLYSNTADKMYVLICVWEPLGWMEKGEGEKKVCSDDNCNNESNRNHKL